MPQRRVQLCDLVVHIFDYLSAVPYENCTIRLHHPDSGILPIRPRSQLFDLICYTHMRQCCLPAVRPLAAAGRPLHILASTPEIDPGEDKNLTPEYPIPTVHYSADLPAIMLRATTALESCNIILDLATQMQVFPP
jgi:hypothetical protein